MLCLNQFIDLIPDMASSEKQDWQLVGHPGIFEKIMLMIGLDSLETLDNCRQVCRNWNTMIMNKIWENPTKQWGTIIQRRIERSWGNNFPSDQKISHAKLLSKHRIKILMIVKICVVLETRGIFTLDVFESLARRVKEKITCPNLPVITSASSLAHHGLLGSVDEMVLVDIELTSVPTEHLISLASSVTKSVSIWKVSGCELANILDSVKSKVLSIIELSLGSEETQGLVQAMESGVEKVTLLGGVTLDIRVLIQFNGQGKCREVVCYSDTAPRYKEQLRTWAKSSNWSVTRDDDWEFIIKKRLSSNWTGNQNESSFEFFE